MTGFRRTCLLLIWWTVASLSVSADLSADLAESDSAAETVRIILDSPTVIPAGTSAAVFRFRAVGVSGQPLESFSEPAVVSGLQVRSRTSPQWTPVDARGRFDRGVLEVTAESLKADRITAAGSALSVRIGDQTTHILITVRPRWTRLLPPVLAIVLAIVFRDVIVSLVLATLAGCLVFLPVFQWPKGIADLCSTVVRQIADSDHASVLLFTALLGSMVRLMQDSGGTQAVISRLTQFARTRRRGMVLTWIMGLFVFFDDYANMLLIGGAMRPLTDRLNISRAKLDFLLDSTAAPIAGLAVSTWTAFEIQQTAAGLDAAGIATDPGAFFWSTIPYRIYPLLLIPVAGLIAFSGRDFGPMLQSETASANPSAASVPVAGGSSVWLAVVPVFSLILITITGFLRQADAYEILLIASFVASTAAYALAWLTSRLTLEECSRSWLDGLASMTTPMAILVLAWSVSSLCGGDRLDTAGYIMDLLGTALQPQLLPAAAFLSAGAISFAIGSSFATMAIMIPMIIPLAWNLLGGAGAASTADPVFAGTAGALLAGAIFGDHCSPISDTTILSSAAAGCDHLEHVATQLPYALLTAVGSLLLGYLPIGFGVPWWVCLPAAGTMCCGTVFFLGHDKEHPEP